MLYHRKIRQYINMQKWYNIILRHDCVIVWKLNMLMQKKKNKNK